MTIEEAEKILGIDSKMNYEQVLKVRRGRGSKPWCMLQEAPCMDVPSVQQQPLIRRLLQVLLHTIAGCVAATQPVMMALHAAVHYMHAS